MQSSSSSSGTGSPKLGDARAASAYDQLVGSAFSRVVERLGELDSGIFVFAPCGCSRAELLKRLMEPGAQVISHAYVYEGFEVKTGDVQGIVKYESLADLVEKLKRWSGGRVAVVPESSCEAVALKQMLEMETLNLRVQLVYLPQLYREAAERYSENVKELAKVEHSSLGEAYGCKAGCKTEGYSSTLLRAWSSEELEELGKAKEAILVLSPGRLGLKDYLAEAAGKMLIALAAAPFGAAVALAVDRLLAVLASLNLQGAAQALLAKVGGVSVKQAEGFASRVLEGWSRPEARNKVAEGLARLVAAAREAAPYLDREELETVVDQVALEWGMDASTFKVFVRNLAKMASGELVTREELRKELEKLVGEELEERLKRLIEDRLREIEEELDRLKGKVEALEIGVGLFYADDLEKGSLYSNFKVEKGKPVIASREEKGRVEAELVTAGSFERLAGEVVKRLEGGFVVLEGPKGIGKSTLAAYAAWRALLNGQVDAILSVSKLDVGEASRLENLVKDAGKRFLVLYDPSPLPAYYEPGAYAREAREAFERSSVGSFVVEETLRQLLSLKGVERVSVLVVLPDDIYRSVIERNPKLKGVLERYTLRVDLRDPQFLEEVVKAYSGCAGSFRELAGSIAKFEGGYTLVAKYAGLTLREKKCSVEDVQTAIDEAEGKPKLFLAYYLWSVLLRGSENYARRVAVPLLLHALFGPVPEGVTYLTATRGPPWRFLEPKEIIERGYALQDLKDGELEPVAKWLSVRHEDLMEEMLEEICGFKGEKARELYAQHLPKLAGYQQGAGGGQGVLEWALNKVVSETREAGTIERGDALLQFTGERLAAALEAYATSCWRRLALVAGSALAGQHLAPLVAASKPTVLPSKALEPCEADDYLLAGGVIPLLILGVALYSPHTLARHLARCYKEAAEEIEKLWKTWRERGAYPVEKLYALGLALSVAEAMRLGEKVEVWEAEAALYAAAAAVQKVSRAECVAAVLKAFKPLGELAPHYHVKLAAAASGLSELDKDAVREIADAVDGALQKHGKELEEKAWPLVEAVHTYSNLLTKHAGYFLGDLERIRRKMCGLLGKLEGQLRVIAEALALRAALERGLEPCGGGGAASRAVELLEKLERMEGEEPSGRAVEWAKELAFKPEEFKRVVKEVRGALAYALASYTMNNDELEAAEELFESSAAITRELEHWENYLTARSQAARCSVLKAGSLEELKERAKISGSLWSEAKKLEKEATALLVYLGNEALALAEYLVSLALEGRMGEVSKLLDEEGRLLRRFSHVGVAVRLLLERLGVKVEKPKAQEIAEALRGDIEQAFRPAFNLLMGLPEGAPNECSELKAEERELCLSAVAAIRRDEYAVTTLKIEVVNRLGEEVAILPFLGISQKSEEWEAVKRFYSELLNFVEERDAGAAVQLRAPQRSLASFVLMLWALSNDNEELARAHAKRASIIYEEKLFRRLFREAAEAQGERFELALLKLFYLHV